MTITIEFSLFDWLCMALSLTGLALAAAHALGWTTTLVPRFFGTPAGATFLSFGLLVFTFRNVRNAAGEEFLEGWATLIWLGCVVAGSIIEHRARGDQLREQARQLTDDLVRMYRRSP